MFCWCGTLSCQRASASWMTKAMWWGHQNWLPGMWVSSGYTFVCLGWKVIVLQGCLKVFYCLYCQGFDGDGPDTCCAAHARSPPAAYSNGRTGEVRKIIYVLNTVSLCFLNLNFLNVQVCCRSMINDQWYKHRSDVCVFSCFGAGAITTYTLLKISGPEICWITAYAKNVLLLKTNSGICFNISWICSFEWAKVLAFWNHTSSLTNTIF